MSEPLTIFCSWPLRGRSSSSVAEVSAVGAPPIDGTLHRQFSEAAGLGYSGCGIDRLFKKPPNAIVRPALSFGFLSRLFEGEAIKIGLRHDGPVAWRGVGWPGSVVRIGQRRSIAVVGRIRAKESSNPVFEHDPPRSRRACSVMRLTPSSSKVINFVTIVWMPAVTLLALGGVAPVSLSGPIPQTAQSLRLIDALQFFLARSYTDGAILPMCPPCIREARKS